MNCIEILNYSSVITALLAAIFWFISAFAKGGEPSEKPDSSGMTPASILIDGADLKETLKKQSKYSAIAAIFAGIASICQALVIHYA